MISALYSVKDCKLGLYMPPFAIANDISALRAFSYSVNDNTVQSNLNIYPADFELYKIAEFRDDSGECMPISPVFICSALQCVKPVSVSRAARGETKPEQRAAR